MPIPTFDRLKRDAANAAYRMLAPRKPATPSTSPGPACVVGFMSAPSGIGESARLGAAGLSEAGFSVTTIDVAPRFGQSSAALRANGFAPDPGAGPLVIHANPPELPAVLVHLGAPVLRDRYRIGYWVWELERAPADWRRAGEHVHEVWTPSRHSAAALAALDLGVPIRVVPHPVPAATAIRNRARFALPEHAFVAATFADFHSSLARKNPADAVAAHAMAFGADPDAILVVKLGRPEADPAAGEKLRRNAASNIRFVDTTMSPEEMSVFVASLDCVLSLHRAEGFGLSLAGAMRAGIPVVATGWSGNLDFMDDRSAVLIDADLVAIDDPQGIYAGGRWAQPRIAAAAAELRRLRDMPDWRAEIGRRGAASIAAFTDPAKWKSALGDEFMKRSEAC